MSLQQTQPPLVPAPAIGYDHCMTVTVPSPRLRSFRRMRAIATLLLLLMTAVFVLSWHFQGLHPALPYVRAFAEAAMIGGLADWFAIVALFRRPFGLPIPHTAIIPANKARIGRSLGDFIGEALLTEDKIGDLLQTLDLPSQAGRWLADETNAETLAGWLVAQGPAVVKAFDWQTRLADIPLGGLLASGLARASSAGLHRPWIDAALERLSLFLSEHRQDIRETVTVHSLRWIPEWVDVRLADLLGDALIEILQNLRFPEHRWRQALDRSLEDLPNRLAGDPDWQAEAARCQHMLLADPALRAELTRLAETGLGLDRDSLTPFLRRAGERLAADAEWQATLQKWVLRIAERVLLPRKQAIGDFVAAMIAGWDDNTLIGKLESEVGADLHFIRLNGTLVGGLVGLILYMATTWLN